MRGPRGTRVVLERGDITKVSVDAIVNAANTSLLGGGGVDGAIHRAAGPELLAECRTLGGCPTGSAKITGGHRLPARHVIHCVGPVYHGGKSGEPELLAGCYRTALKLAVENGCRTIAFPAISCGVYGYPLAEAARVALGEAIGFLESDRQLEKVIFVLYDERAYSAFKNACDDLLGPQSET
jgi:O-acetyl-ADP-ribose deacetylase (regulator of RNase III)